MRDLMSYLPVNYDGSAETRIIEEAIQPEQAALWKGRESLLEQLDPQTATWGLAYWEEAFGIAVDGSKGLDVRRSKIIARIRGMSTTTVELLTNVARSFLPDSQVSVTEVYGEYRVEINFIAPNRLPHGMDDLAEVLDEIMPAHLQWMYVITISPTLYVGGHFTSCNVTYLPVLEVET